MASQGLAVPSVLTFEYSANELSIFALAGATDETSFSLLIIQKKALLVNCHSLPPWPAAKLNQTIAYSALEISRQIGLSLEPAKQNSVQPVAVLLQAVISSK